jgi:hypothetical protein
MLIDDLLKGLEQEPAASEQETVAQLRQDLRRKFLHDEEKVEQAIAFERERQPQAGEVDLLRAAIHRWERDNR